MIYAIADILARGFMWGLLNGLLMFVAIGLVYLLFTTRESDKEIQ